VNAESYTMHIHAAEAVKRKCLAAAEGQMRGVKPEQRDDRATCILAGLQSAVERWAQLWFGHKLAQRFHDALQRASREIAEEQDE
jgi:hypothetical protein